MQHKLAYFCPDGH